MNDALDDLIRRSLDSLRPPPGLARRIEVTVNRRRRIGLVTAVAAALVILAITAFFPKRTSHTLPVARRPDFAVVLQDPPPAPMRLEEIRYTATVRSENDTLIILFKE